MWKRLLLVIAGLGVIGHFVFSNQFRSLGPSYVIKTESYMRHLDGKCDTIRQGTLADCLATSCPININASLSPVKPYHLKGFPFATNDAFESCGERYELPTSDFSLARKLNWTYVTLVSLALVTFLYAQKTPRKSLKTSG